LNVLITRPINQADSLKSLIKKNGHKALLFPTLKIKKLSVDIDAGNYDALIFISINSVEYAIDQINFSSTNKYKVFAVGESTANKLVEHGIKVDCYPKQNASSEELLSMPMVSAMKQKKILIIRGKGGRETLKSGLVKHSNDVFYAEVYKRTESDISNIHRDSMLTIINSSESIVTITSIESLLALLSITNKIDPNYIEIIKSTPLIALSERIRDFAKSVGFLHLYVASETNNKGLVAVINQSK